MAMVGASFLAQGQDTTNYNNQSTDDEAREDVKQDAEDASVEIRQEAQSTEQELQKDADEMEKNFEGATIDKVGPNGEKLFMERGKYYYMNKDGKKVKVKKSDVRDKSENP